MSAAYTQSPETVDRLEKQLKYSLRPVEPSREFVDHLYDRLTTPPEMQVERRQHFALSLLLVSFSLLGGVFAIWMLRRIRPAAV